MSDNRFDDEDTGIFMKQESITSVFDPTPMTPTQNTKPFPPTEPPKQITNEQVKRNESYGNLENRTEARVLVLYTGGTIGMLRNEKNGEKAITS